MVISSGDFSGAHLSFAKKGLFFDFFRFFLENGCPNMSETSIFWKYIQFAIEWYIICLYMIKKVSRFFSQKSTNCPMGRSSLFEPCHRYSFLSEQFCHCFCRFRGTLVGEVMNRDYSTGCSGGCIPCGTGSGCCGSRCDLSALLALAIFVITASTFPSNICSMLPCTVCS